MVGRTGSGKSTLVKVLTREVEPPRGTVRLGGVDVLDLDLAALRRRLAVVPQRTEILTGTLAENVALFDPELVEAAGKAVAELGLDAWVAELPEGLSTRLGEGGVVLSAGQEQLVAFARILVRDPAVVVLDEATARMDPLTESRVQRATERLLLGRIGIVIAHRLTSVRRCEEVVVMADGQVLEAGPLRTSRRFAELMAAGELTPRPAAAAATAEDRAPAAGPAARVAGGSAGPQPTGPAPRPARQDDAATHTMREIARLAVNDPKYGAFPIGLWTVNTVIGLEGSLLAALWANLVDGTGSPLPLALLIAVALAAGIPIIYLTSLWFPRWWVLQQLRIGLRLVHGQTGPSRVGSYSPAAVVAQAGDTERVVMLADNTADIAIATGTLVAMTAISRSPVPGLFFLATMVGSAASALAFGPTLKRAAARTVAARAAFATSLVSALSASRTVKLASATDQVLTHLARLDAVRTQRQHREVATQVWARAVPGLAGGLLPIAVWGLYLSGALSAATTLVAVSALGAAGWFGWTAASLVSQLPSARVWTQRTVAMTGTPHFSAALEGVDLVAGTAPAPPAAVREPLRELSLRGFGAVHEDGTVGIDGVDLEVTSGQLVLVVGPVGSGKSSFLRALAGIVPHTGTLAWNGRPVTEPDVFLRPGQVGYVGQLPRVLSGTVAENVALGQDLEVAAAVRMAQLERDLAGPGGGLGLLIGHKGTRLSGGQLQRLALARALAARPELLVADDVSSALDVATELDLWRVLREAGTTVIGSTSKRAALTRADQVLVLDGGRVVAHGPWAVLEREHAPLAG